MLCINSSVLSDFFETSKMLQQFVQRLFIKSSRGKMVAFWWWILCRLPQHLLSFPTAIALDLLGKCTDLQLADLGFLLCSLSSNGNRFWCTARRSSFWRLLCLLSFPLAIALLRSTKCTDLRSTDLEFLFCPMSSNGNCFWCNARRSSFWGLLCLLSPNGDRSSSTKCTYWHEINLSFWVPVLAVTQQWSL